MVDPLAIIGEVRTQVTSLKKRYEKCQAGPARFQSLTVDLDRLLRYIAEVENLLRAFPGALSTAIAPLFEETLTDVQNSFEGKSGNSFEGKHATMPSSLRKAFVGSGSRFVNMLRTGVRQVTRANALSDEMDALQKKIEKASNQLQHLITVLSNALKLEETHSTVASKLDAVLSKLDKVPGKEVYYPATSAPAPSHTVVLDFDSKDEKGNPATPEGLLKQSVLYGKSSEIVTAAAGAVKPAYGVLGMAGVGKTVALQGLCYDEEIKKRFDGGVLYMKFGRDATLRTAIGQIAKIMTLTGAATLVENVVHSTSLGDAVDYAVMWFKGKICLYLIDDLWPAQYLPVGYFQDIRQLVRGSPWSRMAISTRSLAIASEAGSVVQFGPRETLGKVSVDIFMVHSAGHSNSSLTVQALSPSVSKILSICGGLPIALSVIGCAVAELVGIYGTFEQACDKYAENLENKIASLGTGGSSLSAGMLMSLEYLEVEFKMLISENFLVTDHSISDLYTGLCVLSNQAWVPVSVLSRLWKLDTHAAFDVANLLRKMSLAKLESHRSSINSLQEAGILLHDLQLDFCQKQAVATNKSSFWHTRLLNGYLKDADQPIAEEPNTEIALSIISCTPRPWWSHAVKEDEYINKYLARHLSCAGRGIELAALLLDARWTAVRGRIGGVLALKADFAILGRYLEKWQCSEEVKPLIRQVRQTFEHIFEAVQMAWGRLPDGIRAFHFQICGCLKILRDSNALVNSYLKSVERSTPKPYLVPVTAFLPRVSSAQMMEIPVGGHCESVAFSPCGRYIAAGARHDIVVAKASSGEILQCMRGHAHDVSCVAFTEGSKKLVSGSNDGKVIMWEWESSESPVQVLEGHSTYVTGVAVSRDGGRIFSSSRDGTLRIWDMSTSKQVEDLPQGSAVICVAVCGDKQMIALGLSDGTLRVLDSGTNAVLFEDTEAHKRDIFCVSFSPNGAYLATGAADATIELWATRTWTRVVESFKGHDHWVTSVAFSPDCDRLASSSIDSTVRLWDLESGKCVGVSPKIACSILSVSFTTDGERIAFGSDDGAVRIWDARIGTESKKQIRGHSKGVLGVAVSQNGLRVASASQDRTVQLWDAQTGDQIGPPMEGHTDAVRSVSFSADGRRLVSGSDDATLRLWDTEKQNQIGDSFEGHEDAVYCVALSSDGLRIVSGSWDCTVRIWNAETNEQVGEALQGHISAVFCVSESADGCRIVSRDRQGNTIIWNRENGAIVWKSKIAETDSKTDIPHEKSNWDEDNTSEKIGSENETTDDEAEKIIRSCGQQTPHLWPKSFLKYTAELYFEDGSVYSNLLAEGTMIVGGLRASVAHWTYHTERQVLAVGLRSGAVAIRKVVTK